MKDKNEVFISTAPLDGVKHYADGSATFEGVKKPVHAQTPKYGTPGLGANNHVEKTSKEFDKVLRQQEGKGIIKYGQPLDPLEQGRDWLGMAKEEQADGFSYIEAEMEKRTMVAQKIRGIAAMRTDGEVYDEIIFW